MTNPVLVSWYSEENAPNKTVSMLGSVVCPECKGNSNLIAKLKNGMGLVRQNEIIPLCKRCNGDGLLTSQLPFNSNLLECAIAKSYAIELFGSWEQAKGQVVKVTNILPCKNRGDCSGCDYALSGEKCFGDKSVIVRITDLMQDHLCRCGHVFKMHSPEFGNCIECGRVPDKGCKKYEHRCIDLTRYAFSLLAPLSQGLLTASIERVG